MGLNICFMNTTRPWGGGEKWHHDFALACHGLGHNVHVLAGTGSELATRIARRPGIDLETMAVGNLSFLNPATVLRLKQYFTSKKIQVLVMALPSDLKAGGVAAALAGVPSIIYRRGIGVPVKDTALNRFLYRRIITGLICNSNDTKKMVLAHNPDLISHDKVKVVYNGFDHEEFDSKDATPLYEKSPGEIVIGNAARLTRQKGQTHLLNATRTLKERGLDFTVLIAGHGELEQELKERARELELEDTVKFVGFVENMPSFYSSIDIFALPSLWEGFCYSQAEAMYAGKPEVAFDTGSIPEVAVHGETALLGPKGDEKTLADNLEALIKDPEQAQRLGMAGKKRILENFTMDKTMNAFLKAIEV